MIVGLDNGDVMKVDLISYAIGGAVNFGSLIGFSKEMINGLLSLMAISSSSDLKIYDHTTAIPTELWTENHGYNNVQMETIWDTDYLIMG